MANVVTFYSTTRAKYDALATKDANALYFIEDEGRIFKGTVDVTSDVKLSTNVPQNIVSGKVEIVAVTADGNTMYDVYVGASDGTAIKAIPGSIGNASAFDAVSTYGSYTPTVSAVKTFVENALTEVTIDDAFVDVSYTNGTFTFTQDDETTDKTVTLTGVAHDVVWDASTLTLTIPQYGSETPTTVNIPKDMFVQNGEYVANYTFNAGEVDGEGNSTEYEAPAIVLTINVTDGAEATQQIVAIPVSDLAVTYSVADTATIDLTLSEDHEITAALKFDTETLDGSEKVIVATENGIAKAGKSINEIMSAVDTKISDAFDEVEDSIIGSGDANKVVISTATGLTRSGAAIGGATLATTTDSNTIATEKAVETAIESAITWNTLA